WVRPARLSVAQVIVSKHGAGPSDPNIQYGGYELRINASNNVVFATYDNTGAVRDSLTFTAPPHPLVTGSWSHISGSYEKISNTQGKLRVSLNGDLVTKTTGNVPPQNGTTSLNIGRAGTMNNYFKGRIDEVRISNVVRYTTSTFAPTANQPCAPCDANT